MRPVPAARYEEGNNAPYVKPFGTVGFRGSLESEMVNMDIPQNARLADNILSYTMKELCKQHQLNIPQKVQVNAQNRCSAFAQFLNAASAEAFFNILVDSSFMVNGIKISCRYVPPTNAAGGSNTTNAAGGSSTSVQAKQSSTSFLLRGFKQESFEEVETIIRKWFGRFNVTAVRELGKKSGVHCVELSNAADVTKAMTWLRTTCFNKIDGQHVFAHSTIDKSMSCNNMFSQQFELTVRRQDIYESKVRLPDPELVGTYQWTGRGGMMVPGFPPTLKKPLPTPNDIGKVDSDTENFVNENNYWRPSRPWEAVKQSIETLRSVRENGEVDEASEFNWDDFDFVTDRNNLRKLISFLEDNADKDYKIYVDYAPHLGSRLCIFTRVEAKDVDVSIGYGHNFEHALTSKEKEGSGFYRLLKFKLGSLSLLVRTETDAVEIDEMPESEKKSEQDTHGKYEQGIIRSGNWELVKKAPAVEIKSKSMFKSQYFDWDKVCIQMLIGGVPKMVVGWMMPGGQGVDSLEEYTQLQVMQHARPMEPLFGKLAALLTKIQTFATSRQGSFVITYTKASQTLTMRSHDTCYI